MAHPVVKVEIVHLALPGKFRRPLFRVVWLALLSGVLGAVLLAQQTIAVAAAGASRLTVVYVGSFDRNLYALDARTGARIWSFPTGGSVFSSPAVAGNVVYVGSDDHNVYALNARTGAKIWNFLTGSAVVSSPTVVGRTVYIASQDGNVYALNARTGAKIWNFSTRGSIRILAGGGG